MKYQINFQNYTNNFSIPSTIVDDYLLKISQCDLNVILLIIRNSSQKYTIDDIAKILNISKRSVSSSLKYWIEEKILLDIKDIKEQNNKKPTDDLETINQTSQYISADYPINDAELSYLLECMENQLKRPITSIEHKAVINILKYIGLPSDVVLMAIKHCVSIDKMNVRYLEKVCVSWAEKGILTHQAAEEHLSSFSNVFNMENEIKKIFGISERNLIKKEKDMIDKWFNTYDFSMDIITFAFEKTIIAINKVSFPYIDKILSSWFDLSFKSIEDINNKQTPKKTSSTSYDIDEIDEIWDTIPNLKE